MSLEIDGRVGISQCSCEQKSDGRCSHVGCLLFLIEELALGRQPVISKPSTSQPQKWGQGSKTKKTPGPLHEGKYSKSLNLDKYIQRDPRPPEMRTTSTAELNTFIIEQQLFPTATMWSDLPLSYENFKLSDDRRQLLMQHTDEFMQALDFDLTNAPSDDLSTTAGKHITGTTSQRLSDAWKSYRMLRVTASKFHDFHKCPNQLSRKILWEEEPDISRLPAVKWGIEHEKTALSHFKMHGDWGEIKECGLFISYEQVFLGASPDAIGSDFLIEIKCPYSLRKTTPFDLESLSASQRSSFFCKKIGNSLVLKNTHKYYYQVQCQMYVTGVKKTYFVV